MKLTIEQALLNAVELHKVGRLQDAEALYRAILQAQPNHPDANHNLGVLAVSLNKSKVAIPFFKIALDANPSQGQFWLSYIDALIKEKQFVNARNVLEQGKKRGLAGENVATLESQLITIFLTTESQSFIESAPQNLTQQDKKFSTKKEKKTKLPRNLIELNQSISPPQIEINTLLEHLNKGRYDLAQNKAVILTQQYPNHPLSWKALGALLSQTGELQDAVIAYQKIVAISPHDAEAHSNLGSTLKELGRLEDAVKSYNKAIAIRPDLAEAHSNLGSTLKELGRLEDAVKSYNKAIASKPDLAEAHSNLGSTLKELGRLEEAEASYSRAIRLRPDYTKARNEMLNCLYLMDKKALFLHELDNCIKEDITSSIIGSLTCRSALRYNEERLNTFCNEPLKHVLLADLNSRYNFEEIFVRNAKSILSADKRSIRRQVLLSNGYQTSGNRFAKENASTAEIQKTIRLEIERYRINFKNSKEGFIRKWPNQYSLYGWLICMKSGGELSPHIHENGWLSGSIYIHVPPKSKIDSGNLVVALGRDSDVTNSSLNSKKVIDVVTGNMALFPASLMHHTIPFESEEDRIVLAFDVIPKS